MNSGVASAGAITVAWRDVEQQLTAIVLARLGGLEGNAELVGLRLVDADGRDLTEIIRASTVLVGYQVNDSRLGQSRPHDRSGRSRAQTGAR